METRFNKVEYWARKRLGRFVIVLNRRRSHIFFHKKKMKIVIGEQYENKVKIASRVVLGASVLASFITLAFPYSALLSLGLIFIEQVLERVIYSFQTMLLIPFPSFDVWKKADFTAMVFARDGKDSPHQVGMVFKNAVFAKEVWKYIEDWNYGSTDDSENNISVSIVINKDAGAYAIFVYPSYERPTTQAAKKQFQKGREDKEQLMLIGQMIMCKVFPLNNSAFERWFLPAYKNSEDYVFGCWLLGDPPEVIPGTLQIKKNKLKIIDHSNLTHKDVEYHMVKYSINWHNPDPNRPSLFYVKDSSSK